VGSEGVSFFPERQMRLLCFMERREGNGRKEKRCLHQGKQSRIFAFPHKSVVQGKAILEQFIYGDFLCIFKLPLYLQAFHAVTAWRLSFFFVTASRCLFGNLLVFNFKIIKISICKKIDKLILQKKVKILFYYLFFILTKTYIFLISNIVVLINKKLGNLNKY